MSQQVQELIDKIKAEGLAAADQKARELEEQAKRNAQGILNEANKRAQDLLLDAEEEIRKKQEASRMALQQASRDTLLSLKKRFRNFCTKSSLRRSPTRSHRRSSPILSPRLPTRPSTANRPTPGLRWC